MFRSRLVEATSMTPLLERSGPLTALAEALARARSGEGRTILVGGEAGIGKTSLVDAFVQQLAGVHTLWGACEALSTPHPLGPVYDIVRAARRPLQSLLADSGARPALFAGVLDELGIEPGPTILVLEDVHWADAATLDLVKYLGRRILAAIVPRAIDLALIDAVLAPPPEAIDDCVVGALLLEVYATHCFELNDLASAIPAREEALALFEKLGDRARLSTSLAAHAMPLVRALRNGDADRASRRAIEIAQSLPAGPAQAQSYMTEAYLRMLNRDYRALRRLSARRRFGPQEHGARAIVARRRRGRGRCLRDARHRVRRGRGPSSTRSPPSSRSSTHGRVAKRSPSPAPAACSQTG